jgi:hypothetical protein
MCNKLRWPRQKVIVQPRLRRGFSQNLACCHASVTVELVAHRLASPKFIAGRPVTSTKGPERGYHYDLKPVENPSLCWTRHSVRETHDVSRCTAARVVKVAAINKLATFAFDGRRRIHGIMLCAGGCREYLRLSTSPNPLDPHPTA